MSVSTSSATAGILDGIVVLDFTHVLSGPYSTMILGDLGADVVKIERVDGDETRRSAFRIEDFSEQFAVVNRNKKSVAIDLSTEEGRQVVLSLIPQVDVVVENFRPGTMARLGLDHSTLKQVNPGVIYCSISGFGSDGPDRSRGGFDIVAQAMSGVMSVNGTRDGELAKVGIPICDLSAGLYASMSICAALFRRERTGLGEAIDVSLVHSGMSLLVWEAAQLWSQGTVPGPMGTAHRNRTPYQAFQAKDGMLILGAGNEGTWQALCDALGREELKTDPRFATNPDRMQHEELLVGMLQEIFVLEPVDYWVNLLTEHGCPAGPILDVAQAFDSPHAKLRNMTLEVENPRGGLMPTVGFPYELEGAPPRVYRRPPELGEHTREILRDVGALSADAIDALLSGRIVEQHSPSPEVGT